MLSAFEDDSALPAKTELNNYWCYSENIYKTIALQYINFKWHTVYENFAFKLSG